ncbi:unnamed protein product, partial [Brassica napus]
QNSKTLEPTAFTPGEDHPKQGTNSLEDLLKKVFSTSISYLYASLFEISQRSKAVELLGKKEENHFDFLFWRNKLLTKNEKKHIIYIEIISFTYWKVDHL